MRHWYNNLRKSKKKSLYLLLGLTIVAFLLASYLNRDNRGLGFFDVILKEPYYFISNLFTTKKITNDDKDYQALFLENQALRNEIKALEDLLAVNSLITDYEKITAMVIERKDFEWYSNLLINKGSSDGLVEGLAVINGQGLIGKINILTPHTSTVKLLTNNLKISVLIVSNEQEIYGVLSSYDNVNNIFIIEGISDIINIKVGDKIMTTGLNEIFSKGLMIGTVKNIKFDSFGLSQILEVEPSVDYNNIYFVTVLKKDKT